MILGRMEDNARVHAVGFSLCFASLAGLVFMVLAPHLLGEYLGDAAIYPGVAATFAPLAILLEYMGRHEIL